VRTLPGVADVNALGGLVRTFEVVPDNAAMQARGIAMAQLQQALEVNNRNDGAGRLKDGEEVLLVRSEGRSRASTICAPSSSVAATARRCAWATWRRYASAT